MRRRQAQQAAVSTRPQSRAARRDDDRGRLDDRLRHFHYLGGIRAINRCAGLVTPGLGRRRPDDDHGRALLLRTGDDDAARRRSLCFSARSLRPFVRFSFRLDALSRHSNRDNRRGGDCLCEICRSLRACDRHGSLSRSANSSLWRLRHQSFDRATRGRRLDSVAHLDKHARSRDRKVCPEHIYFCENSGPSRPDRHWPFVRLESRECGALG